MDPLAVSRLLAHYLAMVEAEGITLGTETDWEALYCLDLGGKPLSRLFDPSLNELLPDQGFWIKGTSSDGKVVSVQGARFDDTGSASLSDLLSKRLRRLYSGDTAIVRGEKISSVSGRCVYHGDGWIDPEWRQNGIGETLYRIGVLAILLRFNPDYLYAFFEEELMRSGFPVRCWYEKLERIGRHSHGWLLPTDYVAWISRKDLNNLIVLELDRLGHQDRRR